jgi:hypothetical protein
MEELIMKTKTTVLAATLLTGLLAAVSASVAAETTTVTKTMVPMAAAGAGASGQQYLLSLSAGQKQAVSYFHNDNGQCKLTLMVGEAFNGEDVPQFTTVRFETHVVPGDSARFDTAEGKGLKFTCEAGAQAMSVTALDQVAARTDIPTR